MENNHRRDDSPSGLSDIVEGDGLLGTGLTVCAALFFLYFFCFFLFTVLCDPHEKETPPFNYLG